ncbi:MAG: GAF domain-containing protein [Burkholderiales bacterium]|nr:GAF domain-containing protein [Anaerolineae bacterium]
MAVPDIADWCSVELVQEDGSLEQVAVAHVDPAKVVWAKELRLRYPPDPTITDQGLFHVLQTGASEFYPLITDAMLEESARSAEHYQIMRDIGFTSAMVVPLEARGRILGALTFVSAEGKRQYDQTDLTLAEELGRRAGLAVDNARLYREAQAAREAAEAAQQRLHFLAEASTTLAASLDYETTLKSLAQLVVTHIADWCGIDAPGDNGEFRRLAAVHRNAEKQQLIEQMRQRFHVSPDAPIAYPFVLRTGQSELIPEIPAEVVNANTPDPEALEIVQRINMRSTLCVPLVVRGEVFAALSMGISESGRRYNETDLALAHELARRAAIAIDIAWLYAEAQREIERRTEVENDLRRSEEQLRLVTNSLPVLISYVDSSYRYRFTNYAYREWFGLSSEDIYGKTMTELVGEAVFERVRPYVEQALAGEGVTYEALLPYARGERYVSVSYVPRRNEAGIVVGFYALVNDISERQRAEEEIRQRNEIIEIVSRVGQRMSAELDLQNLVQMVTDAATELTGAEFGAFFYNLIDERGESYTLYTISGVPREEFSRFPMPRNTKVFAPTFDGEGIVRLDDVRKDPRYGQNDPYFGMPEGHLPVVSYLAVPVLSRSGKVLGGLFFGHQEAGVFTEREEGLVAGLAAQAAIGMDNASLFLEAQEQRQQLQVTLSSIGDAVIATDTSGRVTFMNAVAHEITAWGSEAIGEKLETVFHIINEASREIVENPVIKVLREGMIVGLANHTLLVAKDGREIPIDDSGAPIRNEDGQLVGVILVFRDIGERRLIDNLLRSTLERTQELYEISQRIGSAYTIEDVLKALLNSSYLEPASRAALLAFDRTWSDIPPESYELLALAPQEASPFEYVGMHVPLRNEFMLFTRDEPTVITDIDSSTIDHYTRSQLAQFGTRSFITFPLVAGGKWYGMLQLHFPQRHSLTEEDIRYIRGLVDQAAVAIDNIRLLEAEAKARRAAEKADELKLKFLAMISHELRTPLTSIKGFATTLLAEDVQWDAGSERDFLEIISTESDKLTDLIEQLLDLSRLEAGTLRILAESQSVQAIFAATNMQLESVTPEHRLSFDLPQDLPSVLADRQRIGQVLTNLAGNAAKFAPEGTTITITARRSDNEGLQNSAATMVRIDVSDEGMGIPISERELVFEAFQQVVEHSQNKGAGLGLAICRGLIEAHGGRIWIQDREGPGTTVSFTLPIALHIADTDEMNAAGK